MPGNHFDKHFLFIFVDGIGLGSDNDETNPFVKASLPCLQSLLDGKNMTTSAAPIHGLRSSLKPLDACLGVQGMPQSATGQAALLTGRNVPALLGYHYGPKPNEPISNIILQGNLFSSLQNHTKKPSFLNAYPQRFFDAVQSGRRLLSSIPLAVTSANLPLLTKTHLINGDAISADLTGKGWHQNLGIDEIPIISPYHAGKRLAELTRQSDLAFFEFWLSDYAGHSQEMIFACQVMQEFDEMLCGLLSNWDDDEGLILITSDHGNMEDLSTHRHTTNPVPALVIGNNEFRDPFVKRLNSLVDITPAILNFFGND